MNWKKYLSIILGTVFLLILVYGLGRYHAVTAIIPPVQVYFSPNGGCTDAIIKQIDNAKSEILLQAYSFTSTSIAKSLLESHKRGIRVEVILDKSQKCQNYSSATFLANSKIPTFIDSIHAIAHNKVIIIDKNTVITGSFNFTKSAESKNAENLLIIKSDEITKLYIDNWKNHKDHSDPYTPRD